MAADDCSVGDSNTLVSGPLDQDLVDVFRQMLKKISDCVETRDRTKTDTSRRDE